MKKIIIWIFLLATSIVNAQKPSTRIDNIISFDSLNGVIKMNSPSGEFIRFGNRTTSILPISCAAGPLSTTFTQQFGGALQIFDNNNPATSGLLNLQTWAGGSSIDASVGGNLGNGGLLLNYFFGNNTYINTGGNPANGNDGGTVYLGSKVDMRNSLKVGYTSSGVVDLNTSIEVNQNNNNANAVKVKTWNNSIKAFSTEDFNGKSRFVVYGDGRAYFGINRIKTNHPHANCQYQFDGKIGCKELVVIDPTKWADFVFDKNYKLLPLSEVEKFYKKNNHLPSVPNEKEVKEKGINTAEMDAILLQKIEELTLYIVEQQKEINELKKLIKNKL
jgi:hypothetical protein